VSAFNPTQSTFTIEDIAKSNIIKGSKINPLPIDKKEAFVNAAE
jgi:putative component of membrane protein insertase Oxa1/YidC/SpoIIIJ protein YidD